MKLDEPLNFQGYFWLPGSSKQVPGSCSCSIKGEIELRILGSFTDNLRQSIPPDPSEFEKIIGVTENGQPVTLLNCFIKNWSFNLPGTPKYIIHAHCLLFGAGFDKDEQVEFDSISFHSEVVDKWLGITGIRTSFDPKAGKASIQYERPSSPKWQLSNGYSLSANFAWTPPSGGEVSKAAITQKCYIKLEAQQKTPLQELLNLLSRVNNLISFCVDQISSKSEVIAYANDLTHEIDDKSYKVPIKVYFESAVTGKLKLSEVSPPFSFIPYKPMEASFGKYVSLWLELYDKLSPSLDLFFVAKSDRDFYIDNRFLILVQGLESFHRRTSDMTELSPKAYDEMGKKLLACVTGEAQEWIKRKLKYGNEPSLRKRIKDMLTGLENLFGGRGICKQIVNDIVKARNYLTHYDSKLKGNSCSGERLYALYLVLEVLYQVKIASHIGFSNDEILKLCERSQAISRKLREIHREFN